MRDIDLCRFPSICLTLILICDILDEINQIVLAHEVPKDMIHVEIMESMRVLLAKERMLEGEKSHA